MALLSFNFFLIYREEDECEEIEAEQMNCSQHNGSNHDNTTECRSTCVGMRSLFLCVLNWLSMVVLCGTWCVY